MTQSPIHKLSNCGFKCGRVDVCRSFPAAPRNLKATTLLSFAIDASAAIIDGVGPTGRLAPVMPSESYRVLTPGDLEAIIDYLRASASTNLYELTISAIVRTTRISSDWAVRIASRSENGPEGLPLTSCIHRGKLERAKGFEPSTPTLARLCSTPELHPHPFPPVQRTGRGALYDANEFALQQPR